MRTVSFTKAILSKHNFRSYEHLAATVDEIPSKIFESNKLDKGIFRKQLTRLIDTIELEGFVVREARAMTAPDAIFETMTGDYLEIRRYYMRLRKRLSDKLTVLTEMHSIFAYLSSPKNWKTAEAS